MSELPASNSPVRADSPVRSAELTAFGGPVRVCLGVGEASTLCACVISFALSNQLSEERGHGSFRGGCREDPLSLKEP